nr:hypothetical protein [uncultured Celeribacter sp.]
MSGDQLHFNRGTPARLFPNLADTSREGRITSIFLALLPQIPSLSKEIFATAGLRVGPRAKIECFTEIEFPDEDGCKDRPDGLIRIINGKKIWTALVEAKIGRSKIDADQVQRYIQIARKNGIDAVITISNEFVARADHSPVTIPKNKLRKTELFHWSWTWIATECEILALQKAVDDPEQSFLLEEFRLFLNHPSTGVERITRMGPSWKDLVLKARNQTGLSHALSEVEETVGVWFAEIRDLSLQLSRFLGQSVETVIERKLKDDPIARLKDGIESLVTTQQLHSTFRIPDSAADLEVVADFRSQTLRAGMKLRAPQDKKKTRARVNWLLRMVKSDDPRIWVRAHWPGRTQPSDRPISELRTAPDALQPEGSDAAPHSLEVFLIEDCARRFAGRRTFVEDLERVVPEFYDLVGYNLREWRAAPPRPITKPEDAPDMAVDPSAKDASPMPLQTGSPAPREL